MAELSTADREKLDKGSFAFPEQRKEPLENASHVRNAIARFNQVKGVSDDDRDAAWKHIKAAAKKFDVEVSEKSWRDRQMITWADCCSLRVAGATCWIWR